MVLLEETPLHESSGLTKSPGDGAKLDQSRSVSNSSETWVQEKMNSGGPDVRTRERANCS